MPAATPPGPTGPPFSPGPTATSKLREPVTGRILAFEALLPAVAVTMILSMDLFAANRQKNLDAAAPLAARMRPRTLDEFVGQQHFLGPGKLLRRMLEADRLSSVIFYGPPGTGKTTLAQLIANYSKSHFEQAHAAGVGVKEVRQVLETAKER